MDPGAQPNRSEWVVDNEKANLQMREMQYLNRIAQMEAQMQEASAALMFEKAARLRDEITALKKLGLRGRVDQDVQPEAFPTSAKNAQEAHGLLSDRGAERCRATGVSPQATPRPGRR